MPVALLRSIVFAVPVAAVFLLGAAADGRQFGWLEGRVADGSFFAMSGEPVTLREGDVVRVSYGEGVRRVVVTFSSSLETAARVPVAFELHDARGVHAGFGELEVQETGAFVAGRIRAEIDGQGLEGGLRIAPGAAPPARVASARIETQ